ncbi:glycolate oxidase subunit GlcF [Kaarinaea lacus]
MRTDFVKPYSDNNEGKIANDILRRCVHCGFCNATCPTYQLLGDELDGPRGRIYLIKQLLEGKEVTRKTQLHLDRCLICKSCETTCPSGVEYSRLLEIGQEVINTKVKRSLWSRLNRFIFNKILPNMSKWRWFYLFVGMFSALLPSRVEKAFELKTPRLLLPSGTHARRMLMLKGCVQSELSPDTNRAAIQVLDKLGITLIEDERASSCCGALSHHLSCAEDARKYMRSNIDAWWPSISEGIEAIVITASGCAPHVKDYGRLLADDTEYAEKARRVSELAKDISEVCAELDFAKLNKLEQPKKIVFHPPCSLQHGQKITGVVEKILQELGYQLIPVADSHICCGAAGTYSMLQAKISDQLLINKIVALQKDQPHFIVSSNIGCIVHLQRDASVPVIHWVELLADYNL